MKILLVEDHPQLADVSCDILREVYEHTVEHAASGQQALDIATRFQPELMLIDINLPDMDGYELARALRGHPQFAQTTLVALTGLGNHAHRDQSLAAGFDAHFTKPMDFDLLPTLKK